MTTKVKEKVRLGGTYWRLWTSSVVSNLGDGVAQIAYPWLASAVTRDPFLIALIAVVQRLPWLVFALPAGVITDRVDRRKLIVSMDVVRTAITLFVAAAVVANESRLPSPDSLAAGIDVQTNLQIYWVLIVASLLFGFAEVLRDNAAQTILPAIVEPEHLEKANGNMWGAEMVANSFVGPPLGSLLLAIGFAVPFFIDAGTFAVAAGLIFLIGGDFRAKDAAEASSRAPVDMKSEIKEGFLWLWNHPLLRPLAITLGLLNGLGMAVGSTFVLFAQENLDLTTGLFSGVLASLGETFGFESGGAFIFAVLMMGGAIGGILGSIFAARISEALGSGRSLWLTMGAGIVTTLVIGVTNRWWIVFLMTVVFMATVVLWNVITVSLRQTIIPDNLLGRVNSVYRFFGWGMIPIGSAIGGGIVALATPIVGRSMALRWPYFIVVVAYILLLFYALPRLTTERMDAARAEGVARRKGAEADSEVRDDAISEAGIDGAPPPIDE